MTKWLRSVTTVGILLMLSMAASAKPLPPFVLELEPVVAAPLPATVRFVVRVQAYQDLKNVTFSFLLPPGVSTTAQTEWQLTLQAGQPQSFELLLPLEHWPAQAPGAQLKLINGDERFILTDYFVLSSVASKAERGHSDRLRERDGRIIRERAL